MKQKSETNINISSVNKTVTENYETLGTETGNISRTSNLKQKKKLKQNLEQKKENLIDQRLHSKWCF